MSEELSLSDYLKILRKRIKLIAAIVILSTIVTGVVSYFFLQPIYEASTKLIVNQSREGAGANSLDINSVNLDLRLIDTYKEIIKTPYIMDRVVEIRPEFNLTAEQLIDKVTVSSVNNTQVMTLKVQDPSYERAANIVNAVSEVFIQEIPRIMAVDNVSLLNAAKIGEKPDPVKPNPLLNIAISFVASLMLAVGLAFLLEYMDDTIKSEADVRQYLDLPLMAAISKVRDKDLESKSLKSK